MAVDIQRVEKLPGEALADEGAMGRLVAVDRERRFDSLADEYMRLLDDKSIMVASGSP